MSEAVAKLVAALGLDASEYMRQMDAAKARSRGFETEFKSITGSMNRALGAVGVGFSFAAIIGGIRSVLRWADELNEAASQVGMLTGEMAGLNKIAVQNGLSLQSATAFVSKLQNNILAAASGNEKLAKAFEDVGLNAVRLNEMLPADQLMAVMNAAVASGRPLTALSSIVGDKLGPAYVNLAAAMSDVNLAKMDAELNASADSAARLADRLAEVVENLKELGVKAGTRLVEGLDATARFLTEGAPDTDKGVKEFIRTLYDPREHLRRFREAMRAVDEGARADAAAAAATTDTARTTQGESRDANVDAALEASRDAVRKAREKASKAAASSSDDGSAQRMRELVAARQEIDRQIEMQAASETEVNNLLAKRIELESELSALQQKAADDRKRELESYDRKYASAKEKVEEAQEDLRREKENQSEMDPVRFRRDSYESIGGQVGGESRANIAGTAIKQLNALQKIEQRLAEATAKLEQIANQTAGPGD